MSTSCLAHIRNASARTIDPVKCVDCVVGVFEDLTDAERAALEVILELRVDATGVVHEAIPIEMEEQPGERVALVACVPVGARREARSIIWRHHGRQVPFDWLATQQDAAMPESVPLAPG